MNSVQLYSENWSKCHNERASKFENSQYFEWIVPDAIFIQCNFICFVLIQNPQTNSVWGNNERGYSTKERTTTWNKCIEMISIWNKFGLSNVQPIIGSISRRLISIDRLDHLKINRVHQMSYSHILEIIHLSFATHLVEPRANPSFTVNESTTIDIYHLSRRLTFLGTHMCFGYYSKVSNASDRWIVHRLLPRIIDNFFAEVSS